MAFDPKHFLIMAKLLVDDQSPGYNEEAKYRTAISRAYYAAHLISKKKFDEIEVKFPIKDDDPIGKIHLLVIDALIKRNEPIGRMLDDLRKKRGKADYILDWKPPTKYGVGLLILQAEEVINEVYKLKKPEH